jgi:hypothetical protein
MAEATNNNNDEYTPSYYNAGDGLPTPEGHFGKHIQSNKPVEVQREEATRMMTFIRTNPSLDKMGALATTTAPTPLLIKSPGNNNKVRCILGFAPVLSDPFMADASPLEGKLLAISQDISTVTETTMPIILPDKILEIKEIIVPSMEVFQTKLDLKDDAGDGKKWFMERNVTDRVNIPAVVPLPAYLAYDTLTDDIEAHIIWDRVNCTDFGEAQDLKSLILDFIRAAHTTHKQDSNKVQLTEDVFTQRPQIPGKQWARDRVAHLFPNMVPRTPTTPSTPTARRSDFLELASAITNSASTASKTGTPELAGDTEDKLFKKFGMCTTDLERIMTMCGKESGEEDSLPSWLEEIATKHMLSDGKAGVVRKLLSTGLKFDEYPIPITSTLITMVVKKTFAGEEDITTAAGAMKGLSPYTMTAMTAEELEEANTYAAAVSASSAATVEDLQRLLNKKAKAPNSFSALLIVLRTFTNLLGKLFGPTCPLYIAMLSQCIKPLTLMTQKARSSMATTTLASIMWAVYKQTKRFAAGKMTGNEAMVAEWECMAQHITCKQNFCLLEVPVSIAGTAIEIDMDKDKKDKKRKKGEEDTGVPEKPKPPKKVRLKMEIHPLIKKELTDALPRRFSVKNLCRVCDIKGVNHVFPGTNLCLQGALKGFCPFPTCDRVHDGSLVTDELATKAVSLFDPFLKDPSILNSRG